MSALSDHRIPWAPLAALLVLLALAMVWQRVEANVFERESGRLRQEIDRLRYENGLLETKIHQWTSPSHLGAIARKDYGMQPPKPVQVDVLK